MAEGVGADLLAEEGCIQYSVFGIQLSVTRVGVGSSEPRLQAEGCRVVDR